VYGGGAVEDVGEDGGGFDGHVCAHADVSC
jgi:hypothetical protein